MPPIHGFDGPKRMKRLLAAKEVLSKVELELKEAENSRDSIKLQLANVSEMPSLIPSLSDDDKAGKAIKSETELKIDARIAGLEQKLDDLRLQYTEQHPDIVHMIDQFRERKAAEAKLFREQMEAEAKLRGPSPVNPQSEDLLYQQLTMALTSSAGRSTDRQTLVLERVSGASARNDSQAVDATKRSTTAKLASQRAWAAERPPMRSTQSSASW